MILFMIAAAGFAVGLVIGSNAPALTGRILILSLMGLLWPSVWAGKGLMILRSARDLQKSRLCKVSGRVHILWYGDREHGLQVGGLAFDLDGDPSGLVMEGDEYTIYYLEATEEILSVEHLIRGT